MISQQDLDFIEERKAKQKIRSLIASVRNSITSGEISDESAQVIVLAKSLAQQHGSQKDLIAWAEIRLSNNKKYPSQTGIIEGLDSLASIDDLIVEAGIQLKNEKN